MLRLSLMYHIRKIWLRAVNSIRGVWYYGQSLLSQFNLTKLSSHESIYRTPIQPLLFVSQTTAIAVLFRSSFHVNPVSSVNYSYSSSPIGSGEVHLEVDFKAFFFFYLRCDLIGSRTWRKKDNLVLQRPSHVLQGTKITKNVAWKSKASL